MDPSAMPARRRRPEVLHDKENPADAQPGERQRTAAGTGRQPLGAAPTPPEAPLSSSIRIERPRRPDPPLTPSPQTSMDPPLTPAPQTSMDSPAMPARRRRPEVLHDKENPADAQPGERQRTAAGTGRQPLAGALPPPPPESLQNEADLLKEVESLKIELQHVRQDRDKLLSYMGTYKEMIEKSVIELENAMKKASTLQETCSSQRNIIRTLESKLATVEKLKMSNMMSSETMTEYEDMKKLLESVQLRLKEAEQTILNGEILRKKLHNTILELKGNIRVFCRVRPLLPNESGAVSYPRNIQDIGRGIELLHNAQGYSFTFDKVFDHSATQEHVFTEISQLVQSALDGYKVCIFAYGQTGSGKTYTMMGNPELEEQKGMIPRSLEQIFQATQALNSQGWIYKIQASMLEIYLETIRDLLATKHISQDGGSSKHNIKHDAQGSIVSGLTVIDVTSISEVSSLLRRAAQSRSVGRTQMNEESSRSHCVLTLRIFGVNERMDQQVQGVLNLIDLAGSERLNKSGATGDQLKEAVAINKSLSCLSDVIFSIAKKDEHVPFRNSKLTYLLQPCLGGDSKTLMFVNLSPEVSSTGESLCSLRFAARVNSCEIGIPRRQTRMSSDRPS
uniref:Kinesin-like protein n=1 Tax=Zea mays TaxID=4577 RepID=A0A286LPJ4_MAIZE|nr:kindr G11 [Zea mays]ASU92292.1 kindr B1 [Zea mays]